MIDGGGFSFPVVYFDGATESNVGEITVDSSFSFNKFLSFLSHKIGISSHQFSVYLATFGTNQRIPITAKVNFADIARTAAAASSFFFVKRSKRIRRGKPRGKATKDNIITPPLGNVVLLRRDAVLPFPGFEKTSGRAEYDKRLRDLQIEKELYLMRMGIGGVICKECLIGLDDGFHRCIFDAVTACFKSPAGPIARPVRGSG